MLLLSLPALAFDWRAAAWDGAGFWVIQDEDRVYARRLDPTTGFTECVLSWPGRYPSVASADGDTLVVWERGDGEAIEGVRLGRECRALDATPLTIADEAGRQERAGITGVATGWVVAWTDSRGSGVAHVRRDGEVGVASLVAGVNPVVGRRGEHALLAVEADDRTQVLALDAEGRPGATIVEYAETYPRGSVAGTWLHATVRGEGQMLLPLGVGERVKPCPSERRGWPNVWAAALGEDAVVACGAHAGDPAGRLVRVTRGGEVTPFGSFTPPRPYDMHRSYPVVAGEGHVLVLYEEGVTILDARGAVGGAWEFPALPVLREHVAFGNPAWADRYWEGRAVLLDRLPAHTFDRPTLEQPIDRWCGGPCDTDWSVELRPVERGIGGWANARIDVRVPASGTLPAVQIVRRMGRDDTIQVAFGEEAGAGLVVEVPAIVRVDQLDHHSWVRGDTRAFLAQLVDGPLSLRAALKARIAAELATVLEFEGERQKEGVCLEDATDPGFEGAPPQALLICIPTPMEPAETASLIAGARADAAKRQAVVDARYRDFSAALEPVKEWLGAL